MKKCFTGKVKFWKVMKICAVQAMIAMILVGVSMAHNSDGQLLETKITLYLEDAPLEKVLKEIERIGKVKFAYSPDQLNLDKAVSINAIDQTLGELLDKLFEPYQIKYKVHEKEFTITLKRMTGEKGSKDNSDGERSGKTAVLITGHVTDATTNQPLAGVNVIIKGTASGTTTDSEGMFGIQANDDDVLIFSFIGFISFETKINGRIVIDVVLPEDAKRLNEVTINAGYWKITKEEQTGNIARVTAEEIKTQPVVNPLQALSGRMPGVTVTQETGMPGGGIQVQIRGRNSINSGNDPLYIIDGIPVVSTSLKSTFFGGTLGVGSPFSTINPNDIESIEVLKDGAATAVYGSRGANGVILITTKKGTAGKTKFDMSISTGVSQVTHMMPLLNTKDYLTMRREGFKNDNRVPTNANAADLLLWDSTRYTDWQKALIGNTARTTNINATLSGGEKTTQFLFSAGYYKETTVFPGDFAYKRGSGSLSINHKSLNGKLQALLSVNFQAEDNQLYSGDITSTALIAAPNAPEAYVNGNLNWGPSLSFNNPYANLSRPYNVKTNNFRNNFHFDYLIIPGLQFKANLGYTRISTEDYSGTPISSNNPSSGVTTGLAYFGRGSNESWIVEPQLEYKKTIGDGAFTALAGSTFQQSVKNTNTIRGTGYTNDLQLDNMQAAPTLSVLDASNSQYRYTSFFGRLNYSLSHKYFFDLIGRRDGSSRFGPDKRFSNFGSVSGAWIFSNESFIKQNFRFLSFGKLRASYGTSGNDQIGDFGYIDTYSTTSVPYQGSPALYPSRLANPDYSWETNRKFEAGVETGFFEDRIMTTISYYLNRSSNQLVGLPVSGVTGFSSIQANMPATVQNNGIEIELSTLNIKTRDFQWSSSFNLTIPENKLIEFKDLESSSYANRFVIGQSINIDKVYKFQGVNPQTGVYQFKDFNGDLAINSPLDNQAIMNLNPTMFGGLSNNLKYKSWTFSFFFQFNQQQGVSYLGSFNLTGTLRNQPADVMNRWQNPGDNKPIQRFSTTSASAAFPAYLNLLQSEKNYEDASYIRLKNVYLSWSFPKKLIEKVKLQGSELYIQGQNLLTFTGYKGMDPETRSSSNLPTLRTVTIGLRFTF